MLELHRTQLIIVSPCSQNGYSNHARTGTAVTSSDALSVLAPVPAPRLPSNGYPRHQPTDDQLRAAVRAATADADWPRLRWSALVDELVRIGRADIPLARLAEGHIDALRICDQAGAQVTSEAIYGVWASKSGATGARASSVDGGYVIDGTIRFASGAGLLDRALVPVVDDHDRHLLLDLSVRRLAVDAAAWQTSAMRVSRTHTVGISGLQIGSSAVVGPPNFYLDRPLLSRRCRCRRGMDRGPRPGVRSGAPLARRPPYASAGSQARSATSAAGDRGERGITSGP